MDKQGLGSILIHKITLTNKENSNFYFNSQEKRICYFQNSRLMILNQDLIKELEDYSRNP